MEHDVANKEGAGYMTQPASLQISPTWTRDQLEMDTRSEMEWFVALGRTLNNFGSMAGWEQLKWTEEFAAMYSRAAGPVLPVPADKTRYPRGEDAGLQAAYLPTLAQMQEVRDEIAGHLNDLADGKGTVLGPFQVTVSVRFEHVHDAYGRQKKPRHIIHRGEMGEKVENIYRISLLRHLTTLLETYCDQIRRCPHCLSVFLQNRRHQEYCSRRCQSVAVMQKRRAEEKAKSKKKPTDKRQGLRASQRRRARRGTKRR